MCGASSLSYPRYNMGSVFGEPMGNQTGLDSDLVIWVTNLQIGPWANSSSQIFKDNSKTKQKSENFARATALSS